MFKRAGVLVILSIIVISLSGCGLIENPFIDDPNERPTDTAEVIKPASTSEPSSAQSTLILPDTEGTLIVEWASKSGTARTDMLGMLNETRLVMDGDTLSAHRTVEFKPNSPDAVSASGKYVYSLELKKSDTPDQEAQDFGEDYYVGTFTIDWTMFIDRGTQSQNDFHAVYTGQAVAYWIPSTKKIAKGTVIGTAKTTDTFISNGIATPFDSSDDFNWTFASKQPQK